MTRRTRRRWLSLVAAGALGAMCFAPGMAAAAPPEWTKPVLLFRTDGYAGYPLVASDSSGDVHLMFFTLNQHSRDVTSNTQGTLWYAHMHAGVWSTPTDVLVTPGGGPVNLPAMSLDGRGYLHVVWQGGLDGQIYYSHTHVSQAESARSWSRPVVLSNGGGGGSSIFAANDGRLHFVYQGAEGNIHYRHSDDGGMTWSGETTLADTGGSGSAANFPQVVAGDHGDVYVTWNQYQLPNAWPSLGAFSVRSGDRGTSWGQTVRVAPQDYGFITVRPTSGSTVYRVWNSTADIGERRYQFSRDGGLTWPPSQFIPTIAGGFSGAPALALDSAQALHLLTSAGVRAGTTDSVIGGGILEVTWSGKGWSEPTEVSKGVVWSQSEEQPSVTIANGNRMHTVWESDFEKIWYAGRTLDTPAQPSQPVPAAPVTATPAAAPTLAPAAAATAAAPRVTPTATSPALTAAAAQAPAASPTDLLRVFVTTIVPTLLLVGGVVAARLIRRN